MTIYKYVYNSESQNWHHQSLSDSQNYQLKPSEGWRTAHIVITAIAVLNAMSKLMPLIETKLKTSNGVVVDKIVNFTFRSVEERQTALIIAAIFVVTLATHSIYYYRQNPKDNFIKLCKKHLGNNETTMFKVEEKIWSQDKHMPCTSYITVDRKNVRDTNAAPAQVPNGYVSVDALFERAQAQD